MAIRKRSQSEGESSIVVAANTKSSSTPIVIEVDDCACVADEKPIKRARTASCSDCTSSLNLLVKAMERVQQSAVKPVMVDRVPSMCHEIKSSAASSVTESPFPVKSISTPNGAPLSAKPILPMGRPLLAPPRLPTNLRPGQIMMRQGTSAKSA